MGARFCAPFLVWLSRPVRWRPRGVCHVAVDARPSGPSRPQPRSANGPVNGAGKWAGRTRSHLSMVYNTPLPGPMARRGALCTNSVLNTPGLGSGAGVGAPRSIPVTLSPHSSHKPATKTCASAKLPPAPSPAPLPCRLLRSRPPASTAPTGARPGKRGKGRERERSHPLRTCVARQQRAKTRGLPCCT